MLIARLSVTFVAFTRLSIINIFLRIISIPPLQSSFLNWFILGDIRLSLILPTNTKKGGQENPFRGVQTQIVVSGESDIAIIIASLISAACHNNLEYSTMSIDRINLVITLNYRECKIRRNMLTTNPMQGQVRCCQIWGRRKKRMENHMSGP